MNDARGSVNTMNKSKIKISKFLILSKESNIYNISSRSEAKTRLIYTGVKELKPLKSKTAEIINVQSGEEEENENSPGFTPNTPVPERFFAIERCI